MNAERRPYISYSEERLAATLNLWISIRSAAQNAAQRKRAERGVEMVEAELKRRRDHNPTTPGGSPICTFCGNERTSPASFTRLVQFGKARHAHPDCLLANKGVEVIDELSDMQIRKFPYAAAQMMGEPYVAALVFRQYAMAGGAA